MDEHKQHNVHDHSEHGQQAEDYSQHDADDHTAHAGMDHPMHTMSNPSAHAAHQDHAMPASGAMTRGAHSAHAGHGVDHGGHEQMFRVRFWWCLLLSIPVLLYSGMIQTWPGFTPPAFPFSEWIPFLFSVIIFAYGGVPFLQMAVPELQDRKPGMMILISLAISVAFIYSVAAQFMNLGEGFFWELVTLIDIMLLGHWLEMRSVRQASGALNELAKLLPDTAERINDEDQTETVPVSALRHGDLLLVRPGASVPADVGIAIGGGTDVAIESAGIVLVNSNPLDVVKIFKLSRASYNKMIQNLWWAAGYNIVAIPLAAGVLANSGILLSPAVGALLMSLSTIVVALNAQLLRRAIL